MSLKAFHILFIAVSAALCLFMILWGVNGYRLSANGTSLGVGIVGVVGVLALIPYYRWFQNKFRNISLVFLLAFPLWLVQTRTAWSCAVCFGDPDSTMTKGIKAGIILLILVVGGVLGVIATIGLSWARRAKALEGNQ